MNHIRNEGRYVAAGDDCVMWVEKEKVPEALKSVEKSFSKKKGNMCYGLGQVVKMVDVREGWDIDFCSKAAFYTGQGSEGWYLLRDPEKVLKTNQEYHGECAEFYNNPKAHGAALSGGIASELPLDLITEVFESRAKF